jgi:ferredoxin
MNMRVPIVDIGRCTLCLGCVEVCPTVFRLNDSGYIQVADLPVYPEDEVEEAIKYCPEDCICWEEI